MSDYLLVAEPQFIYVPRPDLKEVDFREDWINPAAIAMVSKHQKGNVITVWIRWISGKATHIEDPKAAKVFLDRWQAWHGEKKS